MDVLKDSEAQKQSMSYIGFSYCNKLYSVEKGIKELPLEERNKKRLAISLPIFEEFKNGFLTKS